MADAEWIHNIKKIVLQAVEAGDPCDIVLGVVMTAAPLAIQIDQKITIKEPQLLLARHVTDHTEQMSIPGIGSVTVTVKGALKPGEQVILIQKRGGQQYLVADRR